MGSQTEDRNNNSKTIFGLLRHGITLWNEEKRVQGSLDSPLSDHGRKRTRAWAKQLGSASWQRIVASDLGRVRETVAILNEELNLPTHFDSRLREMHWGKWEGAIIKEVYEKHGEMVDSMVQAGWDFRPPAGESRREAMQRAQNALLDAASKWPGEKILVTCHLGIIKCLICAAVDSSFLPGETPKINKDSLHLLEHQFNDFSCLEMNIPLEAEK